MRFNEFWSDILSENNALKWGVAVLAAVSIALMAGLLSVATREPLIVERGCFDKALSIVPAKHTDEEIERFGRLAASKRFDSDASDVQVFLTPEEQATRSKEIDELSKKGMVQRVVVNAVKVGATIVTVDADRVISFGNVRSALSLPLALKIKATDRSPANPYGLILAQTSLVPSEEKK